MAVGQPEARRRLRGPQRREKILVAAIEEFAEHGFDDASMARIGRASGVTRTVLYDHFSSKCELYCTVLASTHTDLLSHLRAALLAEGSMEQRMRACADSLFKFAEERPRSMRLLFPERAPVDPVVAAEYRRLRAEANLMMARLVAPDARRLGIDPRSDVGEALFTMQQAALHAAVRWWRSHPDVSRGELVEAAMSLLWTGFGALERR
jgi:AcrR family transcriptional regulator